MIEAMATKGYWSRPAGKTPHATLVEGPGLAAQEDRPPAVRLAKATATAAPDGDQVAPRGPQAGPLLVGGPVVQTTDTCATSRLPCLRQMPQIKIQNVVIGNDSISVTTRCLNSHLFHPRAPHHTVPFL